MAGHSEWLRFDIVSGLPTSPPNEAPPQTDEKVAHSVADVLGRQVTLMLEGIKRMYLNVRVKGLSAGVRGCVTIATAAGRHRRCFRIRSRGRP